ncbi:class F sortase [Frankia sp. CH37]|nr:class F sortase [Parafrankia sp. CH37]
MCCGARPAERPAAPSVSGTVPASRPVGDAAPTGGTRAAAGPTPGTAARTSTGLGAGQVAEPVRVRIPAISVSAPVVSLTLDDSGRLRAPSRFEETGWNAAGPEPGEPGTAVIAGHVDSRTGPAVFFRLRELVAGDRVEVERADGSSAVFVVRRRAWFPKDALPAAEVYGPTGAPELRLITCGGVFDRARSSYRDNLVVFADLP